MASRADELFDCISDSVLDIPACDLEGVERLERRMKKQLSRYPVEDEFSIVKKLDFTFYKQILMDYDTSNLLYTYMDVMPKVNLNGVKVRKINKALRNITSDRDLVLNFNNAIDGPVVRRIKHRKGKTKISECYVPIFESTINKKNENVYNPKGFVVLECINGFYQLPAFRQYKAPMFRFNYMDKGIGKEIVKDAHKVLSGLV